MGVKRIAQWPKAACYCRACGGVAGIWGGGPASWWLADMGYLSAQSKAAARVGWQTAVVTKLRAGMKLVAPYVSATQVECPQGQRLEWWELDAESGQQWFRAPERAECCAHCWEAGRCPRHFGYAVGTHETLLGLSGAAAVAAGASVD